MSEVNKPDGVTVKIPRNALIGGGAVALVGLGLAAGLVLRSPSSTPPASADVSASSPEALASTASQASAAETPMAAASAQATPPNTQTAQVIEPVPVPVPHKHRHETVHQEAVATPPVEQTAPVPAPVAEAPRPAPVCANCGMIESVRAVQQQGQGTGLGAVAGGVLGGVVGNQMGKGGGKTAMTLLGALGGGFAGNAVEKQTRTVTVYEVHVRMDDGSTRTFTQHTEPAPGTRVTVDGQGFHAMQ